jgi:hypothetical protein
MKVMVDWSRPVTTIQHTLAKRAGLRACGDIKWLFSEDEEPEYSSCEHTVPVMDWMGRTQLIMAKGVS